MALAERVTRRIYHTEQLPDPGLIKTLFGSPKLSLLFLPLRLYLGWQWLSAGIEKVNSPAWTRTGTALQGFWAGATKAPAGAKGAAVHYGWYHDFLQYMLTNHWYTWFAKLIAFGETAIGIALILGAFTGLAALAGATLNFNFMLAGSASINPVLFGLAVLLLLGWKVAGYLGADYYLLPLVGTPWRPGRMAEVTREPVVETEKVRRGAIRVASWVAAFGLAGVVAVVANNQWNEEQPLVGYLVAGAAVLLAWLVGEAVLTATHKDARETAAPITQFPARTTA